MDLFAPQEWFASVDLAWSEYVLIALAGILVGAINTLAGSGSLITLPILIFLCGLPAPVANGTNRIGVMIQSLVGIIGFKKSGKLVTTHVEWLAIPAIIGAILGSAIAVEMNEQWMNISIGILMFVMLLVLLINPKRWIKVGEQADGHYKKPLSILTFFMIGVYGGFIQAGVGIFLLAGLVLSAKYSLGQANGIKLLLVFLFNLPAIISFFIVGQVHIGFGLLLAVFQSVGAVIGVRFIARIPNANVWIHRLLIVIVLASAIKFLVVALN